MALFKFRRQHVPIPGAPIPLPPGELTHLPGINYEPTSRITLIDFWGDHFIEKVVDKVEDCFEFAGTSSVTWINVEGLGNLDVIQKLGEAFKLHPLALEDVLHTDQRPKVDDYENCLFLVFRELHDTDFFETEQVSVFLGGNYLITFQETIGDPFDGVRERLRRGRPRLRSSGPDYLAYALLDAIMDSYFPILERYQNRMVALEDEAGGNPTNETPRKIQNLRRDILEMRRVAWSTRELLLQLQHMESPIVTKPTQLYIRDVYDHAIAVMEMLESYRDTVSSLLEIYHAKVNVMINDVMKALTLMATLFTPALIISSLYGMNMKLPLADSDSTSSFWVTVGTMLLPTLLMLIWFRTKKWI